jgi:8-oxo-dGTP pyrophosphatase MutT (NUDIX family)
MRLADLPPPRLITSFTGVRDPKRSAILVPIGDLGGEAAVVATRRPDTMKHHSAMWVFPGGRLDPDVDRTTIDTVIREGCEELGMKAADIRIVGQLNSHGPISSGYLVDVFAGLVDLSALAPDPREVADCQVIPISALAADTAYHETFELPEVNFGSIAEGVRLPVGRVEKPLRFFDVREGEHLWGLQGEIIHELLGWLLPAPSQLTTFVEG